MLTKNASCGDFKLELYNGYAYRPQLFKIKYNTCLEKPRFNERYDKDTINSLNTLIRSANINSVTNNNQIERPENNRY